MVLLSIDVGKTVAQRSRSVSRQTLSLRSSTPLADPSQPPYCHLSSKRPRPPPPAASPLCFLCFGEHIRTSVRTSARTDLIPLCSSSSRPLPCCPKEDGVPSPQMASCPRLARHFGSVPSTCSRFLPTQGCCLFSLTSSHSFLLFCFRV